MRILVVTHFFPPDHWAGTEVYTYRLAKTLKQRGHFVRVLCVGRWTAGRQYFSGYTDDEFDGVPVRRLNLSWELAPHPFEYLYRNPVTKTFLETYITEFQPDLLHVTSCYALSGSVIEASKSAGVPVVLTLADFWFVCPRINLIHADGHACDGHVPSGDCTRCMLWGAKAYRFPKYMLPDLVLDRLFRMFGQYPLFARRKGLRGMVGDVDERRRYLIAQLNSADKLILPSRFLMDSFSAHGVSPANMAVVPWGVDREWLNSPVSRIESSILRIGYIGRVVPIKGVHLLLDAFTKLQGHVSLAVFGRLDEDLAYSTLLRDMADDDGRIEFLGSYLHSDLSRVLSKIDVLVVPSIAEETYCLAAREGLLAGIPVIGSKVGAIPEAIRHGENGFLFESGNSSELAEYLQCLVSDRGVLQQLGHNQSHVKTVEQEADELICLYQEVLSGAQRIGRTG